ncbi:hypothetical protein [Flagellimonas sp.]|uniref:hypothetical protein n=1 Tax=Flagellimonas sp. TaxID=2058762 RepID=UPI003BAA8676
MEPKITIEEKLEARHIVPYIGTGLRALYGNPPYIEYREVEIIGIVHREWETHPTRIWADNMESQHIWLFRPLLHPLDRISEPILEGGINISDLPEVRTNPGSEYGHAKYLIENGKSVSGTEHWFVELLFRHHFDVFGLIDKNLAETIKI